MSTRYQVDRAELGTLLADQPRYRVDQIWEGWYRQFRHTAELSTLPKALRARLDDELPPSLELVTQSLSDDGDTTKFLWRLGDGATVETVLMLYPDRATVCISTQAGCAMDCSF